MKYNRIILYYFSGTGNAKNTAFWIADEAKKLGFEADIINITTNKKISQPQENTLIGFISPTHGFHFPGIMRKFIRRFPNAKNCSTFVMNTRAGLRAGKIFIPGLSGVLHYWAALILYSKGFKIVGLQPVDLPSNWLSLHPAIREKGIKRIYQHIEPKVRNFAQKILNGKISYRALFDIIQDIIVSPLSILYIFFGKYLFAKSFIASSECTLCGLCENACPVQAIKRIDNRMFWTTQCGSCMKYMNHCLQKAIMVTILFFPLLLVAYRIMHWLMRFRLFERIFVLTSLTNYKFWGRYNAPGRNKY